MGKPRPVPRGQNRAGVRLFKSSAVSASPVQPGASPGPLRHVSALAQPIPSGTSGFSSPLLSGSLLSPLLSCPICPILLASPTPGNQPSIRLPAVHRFRGLSPAPEPLFQKQHSPETQIKSQVSKHPSSSCSHSSPRSPWEKCVCVSDKEKNQDKYCNGQRSSLG